MTLSFTSFGLDCTNPLTQHLRLLKPRRSGAEGTERFDDGCEDKDDSKDNGSDADPSSESGDDSSGGERESDSEQP